MYNLRKRKYNTTSNIIVKPNNHPIYDPMTIINPYLRLKDRTNIAQVNKEWRRAILQPKCWTTFTGNIDARYELDHDEKIFNNKLFINRMVPIWKASGKNKKLFLSTGGCLYKIYNHINRRDVDFFQTIDTIKIKIHHMCWDLTKPMVDIFLLFLYHTKHHLHHLILNIYYGKLYEKLNCALKNILDKGTKSVQFTQLKTFTSFGKVGLANNVECDINHTIHQTGDRKFIIQRSNSLLYLINSRNILWYITPKIKSIIIKYTCDDASENRRMLRMINVLINYKDRLHSLNLFVNVEKISFECNTLSPGLTHLIDHLATVCDDNIKKIYLHFRNNISIEMQNAYTIMTREHSNIEFIQTNFIETNDSNPNDNNNNIDDYLNNF